MWNATDAVSLPGLSQSTINVTSISEAPTSSSAAPHSHTTAVTAITSSTSSLAATLASTSSSSHPSTSATSDSKPEEDDADESDDEDDLEHSDDEDSDDEEEHEKDHKVRTAYGDYILSEVQQEAEHAPIRRLNRRNPFSKVSALPAIPCQCVRSQGLAAAIRIFMTSLALTTPNGKTLRSSDFNSGYSECPLSPF